MSGVGSMEEDIFRCLHLPLFEMVFWLSNIISKKLKHRVGLDRKKDFGLEESGKV